MLQQLGAHGRTAAVEGCNGQAHQGWLRSPFGGHGGKQHDLWRAQQGTPPVKEMALADRAIVVRAIRHHDDHDTRRGRAG